jgi:hypothetical protein
MYRQLFDLHTTPQGYNNKIKFLICFALSAEMENICAQSRSCPCPMSRELHCCMYQLFLTPKSTSGNDSWKVISLPWTSTFLCFGLNPELYSILVSARPPERPGRWGSLGLADVEFFFCWGLWVVLRATCGNPHSHNKLRVRKRACNHRRHSADEC